MAVTMCFCLGDLSDVVDSPTGYPFIQVFYNATQSYAATNVLVAIMIVTLTACCVSEVATSSRQLWSFARDKGIPFSDWFAQVTPPPPTACLNLHLTIKSGFPKNAHTVAGSRRFHGNYLHRIPHQHRLHHRPQRHRFPRCRLPPNFLLHHHRVPDLETAERGAVTSAAVVAWEIRARDQCRFASFPHPDLCLCVLASGHPRSAKCHELGGGDVWWGYCLVVGVLRCLGERFLCWAGGEGEARSIALMVRGLLLILVGCGGLLRLHSGRVFFSSQDNWGFF